MTNRYAIVENGLVVNVVIGQPEIKSNQALVECPNAGIGWGYVGGNFVEPEEQESITVPLTKEQLLAQIEALTAQIQALS